MPLPSNANHGFVAGQFIDGTGVPAAGKKITFTPSVKTLLDAGATPNPVTILPKKITITLDENGYVPTTPEAAAASMVGQHLLATTDPDLNPTGWTWKADFAFTPDLERSSYSFALGVGEQIDLTTESPISASGGAVIVQGVPTGGAEGYILGKASPTDYDTEWIPAPSGGTGLPAGGTAGQALVKQSGTAGDATWQNLAAGNLSGLAEAIDDRVAALLVAGANVSLTYDDASGTLTIASSGGGGGGAVSSVNLQTGAVVLDAADVGALPDTYVPSWGDVTGKPAVIAAGADVTTARAAIGAGTSNLALGTTATTAMAGNKTAADLGGVVGTGISSIVKLTQAEYDAIPTPDPATLYWIV